MPTNLLWPDRRIKPSASAVEVDWNNQIARGLGVACLLDQTGISVDVMRHRAPTSVSGGGFDDLGRTFTSASSNYIHMPANGVSGYGSAAGDTVSIVVVLRLGSTSTATAYQACANNGDANSGWAFGWYEENVAGTGSLRFTQCGYAPYSGSTITKPSGIAVMGCSYTSGSPAYFYLNGAAVGSQTTGNGANGSATASFRIGGRQSGAYFNGSIGAVFAWRRQLSADEQRTLGVDPYCCLVSAIRSREYAFLSSSPATFKAAWAIRPSRTIGTGVI